MPSGNKSLPEPVLTKIPHAIWCHITSTHNHTSMHSDATFYTQKIWYPSWHWPLQTTCYGLYWEGCYSGGTRHHQMLLSITHPACCRSCHQMNCLTHWGRDKMVTISFSNAFSLMKMHDFHLWPFAYFHGKRKRSMSRFVSAFWLMHPTNVNKLST